MAIPTPLGPTQVPSSFDDTRVSPEIREALRDHSPEIQRGVRNTADLPPTPRSGLVK